MTFPQAHQAELIALAELSGIQTSPNIFRIILELLALQVSPEDIYILLKQISMSDISEQSPNNMTHLPDTNTAD